MAMKFWFGKKESEPEPFGAAKRGFADGPADASDGAASPAERTPLYAVSLRTDGSSSLAALPVEQKVEPAVPDAAAVVNPAALFVSAAQAKPAEAPVVPPEPAVPQTPPEAPAAPAGRGGAPAAQAAPLPLKAVGAVAPALRLTPRAPEGKAGSLAAALPTASDSPQAGAPAKPVFGLRVKADAAAAAAPVSGAPAGGPAATSGTRAAPGGGEPSTLAPNDWVRPKPDQRVLYYQLMDGLYDAILILDDQGHVVDGSKRITEILGYTREETWDMPIEKIITGMSRQMFEHLRRNLKENHHILIDARCFRKDGTSFAGEVGVSTLTLTNSSNMVFAIRNVERRKNAMDEMRRSQSAFETALSPGFVCDVDGFFQVVNAALLEAFGIPDAEQAKRVRFVDLLPDAARLFLRAACGDRVREKLSVASANGIPVSVELALSPLKSGQTVTGVAGSMQQLV